LISFEVQVGKIRHFGLGVSTQKADGFDFLLDIRHGKWRVLKI